MVIPLSSLIIRTKKYDIHAEEELMFYDEKMNWWNEI